MRGTTWVFFVRERLETSGRYRRVGAGDESGLRKASEWPDRQLHHFAIAQLQRVSHRAVGHLQAANSRSMRWRMAPKEMKMGHGKRIGKIVELQRWTCYDARERGESSISGVCTISTTQALGQSLTISMARREQKSETSQDALENISKACAPAWLRPQQPGQEHNTNREPWPDDVLPDTTRLSRGPRLFPRIMTAT